MQVKFGNPLPRTLARMHSAQFIDLGNSKCRYAAARHLGLVTKFYWDGERGKIQISFPYLSEIISKFKDQPKIWSNFYSTVVKAH